MSRTCMEDVARIPRARGDGAVRRVAALALLMRHEATALKSLSGGGATGAGGHRDSSRWIRQRCGRHTHARMVALRTMRARTVSEQRWQRESLPKYPRRGGRAMIGMSAIHVGSYMVQFTMTIFASPTERERMDRRKKERGGLRGQG